MMSYMSYSLGRSGALGVCVAGVYHLKRRVIGVQRFTW